MMLEIKKISLPVLLFSLVSLASAQETKKVSKNTSIQLATLKENYEVLKTNPKIKQGSYSAQIRSYAEKGQYDQDKKSGIWEFSKNGVVFQKYDFSKEEFLLDEPSKMVKIKLLDDNGEPGKDLEPIHFYTGGDPKIMNAFLYFIYPRLAAQNKVGGVVTVSAILTKDGKIINEKAESKLGSGLEEEVLRIFEMIPPCWIPLQVDGKPVDVKISIQSSFMIPKS
ncbi:hypothetical protein DBR11_26315 [Pedobacter sp. HMWF019]|uniref:energy transducer TonB n=1 Tax=Pedobacter sp. HMWF019 TaxID=2056856 RepID=UPI000D3BF5F5|nr:energy transducer TonB [Pedobacter sp. HMWF019]PTS92773.1 hypothetical protein DBR11_26315 [Pedobacter sp. HMWF019]